MKSIFNSQSLSALVQWWTDLQHHKSKTLVLACVLSLLVLSMWAALQAGAVGIDRNDWFAMLTADRSTNMPSQADVVLHGNAFVLWYLRVPRVVLAVLIGAALGLSGTLVQGLFRNPLADPSLLGVTTGAACAAALTIVLLSERSLGMSVSLRVWLLPIVSFLGAFLTCMALNLSVRWLTPGSIAGLLLLGIALNALGVAVIGLCTYLATDEQLRSLSFWTLGSLSGASWTMVLSFIPVLTMICIGSNRFAHQLNALSLGETTAKHLGIALPRLRWSISVMVALLSGLSVAFCGVIGFIGLIAPHLARALVGADQRILLPLSMLVGALLMLAADTMARTVAIPAEVPVGIFTALLGGPFLMLLLYTKHQRDD